MRFYGTVYKLGDNMKIDEMSEIQDVLKCSKDEKYAAQIKGKLKDIKAEISRLKSEAYEANRKLRECQQEHQKINRILAQSRGVTVINDVPITIVNKGRYEIYIDRAGDNLKKYARPAFEINKRFKKSSDPAKKNREVYVDSVRFDNKCLGSYDYATKTDRVFPDIEYIKDIGCKYVSGQLTADEAMKLIEQKCVITPRQNRW
jgi:hypothetical protein